MDCIEYGGIKLGRPNCGYGYDNQKRPVRALEDSRHRGCRSVGRHEVKRILATRRKCLPTYQIQESDAHELRRKPRGIAIKNHTHAAQAKASAPKSCDPRVIEVKRLWLSNLRTTSLSKSGDVRRRRPRAIGSADLQLHRAG